MWENMTGNAMFKEILSFKKERKIVGYSIMEVVIMYCEELDKDIEEVGALLKKDKAFVGTMQEDLRFHNEATFKEDTKSRKTMSEWL